MNTKPALKLWIDAPCSLNYVTPAFSLNKVPRFQVGSIYHQDQVNKSKRIFTQFERPQLLLANFRRQLKEASYQTNRKSRKTKNSNYCLKSKRVHTEGQKKSQGATTISKFYIVPEKAQYKYDRNGFRSTMYGNYNVKKIAAKKDRDKTMLSTSKRLDLSKPLNFYPGPGAYSHKLMTVMGSQTKSPSSMGQEANNQSIKASRKCFISQRCRTSL